MESIKMNIFQIVVSLIAIVMIYSGVMKFFKKENRQTLMKLLITIFIWTGVLSFTLYPQMAQQISMKLGLGGNLNTLIFAVFVVIFLILFKILSLVERLERNVSEIVREEALKKIKEEEIQK